jgi:hypothetical protein
MTYRRTAMLIAGSATFVATFCIASFARDSSSSAKRARPPKWTADDLNAFFEDARTKLVGARPDYEAATVAASENDAKSSKDNAEASAADAKWSKLIDAETIETEVKRLAHEVGKSVTTPSQFKGGTYEDCRRMFSELALLFAVAAEYDGDVRWKDSAPGLRDLFARAGRNCKVGTDQTFRESAERKQDLADLVAGSRPAVPPPGNDQQWAQVADRPPLMQRLEIAHEERLTKWLANEREFEKHRDDARLEAQLVAVIADVIGRDGYDYWEEEDYAKNVRELRGAASDVSAAVEADNFEQARQGVSRATKACAACHELYRG